MTKDVLITGAASGLGKATAEHLLEQGWYVFAADIDEAGLAPYAASPNATPIAMDITEVETIEAARRTVEGITDGLDGVVNCAGIFDASPVTETDVARFERIIAINFLGAYAVTQTMFPLLYTRKGRVVNISSEAAKVAAAFGLYGISKQCLESYHTALRQELALLGMGAILIRPGAHDTPMSDAIRAGQGTGDEGSLFHKEMESMREQASRAVAEPADPRDVARAVFLALTEEKPKPIYEVNADRRLTVLAKLPSGVRERLMARLF